MEKDEKEAVEKVAVPFLYLIAGIFFYWPYRAYDTWGPQARAAEKRLVATPHFQSSYAFIRGRCSFAVDFERRKFYLADNEKGKVYEFSDLIKFDPKILSNDFVFRGHVRLIINDRARPSFKIYPMTPVSYDDICVQLDIIKNLTAKKDVRSFDS